MMLVGIEYEVSDRNVTRACEKHRNSFLFPLTKKTKRMGFYSNEKEKKRHYYNLRDVKG